MYNRRTIEKKHYVKVSSSLKFKKNIALVVRPLPGVDAAVDPGGWLVAASAAAHAQHPHVPALTALPDNLYIRKNIIALRF